MGNGGKATGFTADHSSPSTAAVKNEWSHIYGPIIRLHGVHRKNFTVPVIYVLMFCKQEEIKAADILRQLAITKLVFFDLIEAPYKQERTTCLAVQKSMQIFS
jgi:hypothetical protein